MRPAGKRKGMPMRRVRRDGGVALILALVFTVMLTALVFGFMYESEVTASLVQNGSLDFQALLAAKSAVANGMATLMDDQIETEMNGMPEVDSMLDPSQWAAGLPFEPLNEAMMRTTISDEYGKINLNALIIARDGSLVRNEELINALRIFFSLRSDTDRDPVDAILDWLDYDDMDAEEPEGAENDYYMGLENPFACNNGPMHSIEELLLIKGITPELYFGDPEQEQLPLSEYLTVHGDWRGRVNANTAREEVIAAVLGGATGNSDIGLAQQIFDEARTQPFEDTARLSNLVSPALPPAAESAGNTRDRNRPTIPARPGATTNPRLEEQMRQQELVGQMFRVNSNVFRIYGDGMVEDVLARVEAYVWRTPLDLSEIENYASSVGGSLAQDSGVVPETPMRVLDWKVIR